jgi:two-component system sensor histidine kinase BaeS
MHDDAGNHREGWAGPPWRGAGFRPPWWPENEPFPPAGRRPWGGRRPRFVHRMVFGLAILFVLLFATSGLAVALVSGALGIGHHRGLAVLAGTAGLLLLFGGFVLAGRAVRRTAVPVSDVMEAADRLAAGDHAVRLEERGSREMRRLARSFNQMAHRLHAAEEQRRNLLADVAHELRTPLSVIQGNTEGIIDGLYPADRPHLEPILEETRVMARLLEDLQTLSTAEAGALRLHRQRVEPRQMLEEAEAVFDPRAQAAGVTLTVRAAAGLPMLDVDPVRIGEVLTNLLTNALRAVPAGGTVTVSADPAPDGHGVAFAVRDTGPGIPPERLPSVFDRFVKSADSGGAGLGLAIAKSLVEAHGGRIDVESAPGRGTTMRFVLPA